MHACGNDGLKTELEEIASCCIGWVPEHCSLALIRRKLKIEGASKHLHLPGPLYALDPNNE